MAAKKDRNVCDDLIHEYKNFIASVANKVTGKFVTLQDDEMSIAMIAFNESIQKYEEDKGNFLSFAAMMIKSRIIDYLRKEKKTSDVLVFSSLSQTDKDGSEIEFDIEDETQESTDVRYEIKALTEELKLHNISFLELSNVSPKSKKTRLACFEIINYILSQPILISELRKNHTLPIKSILENVKVNRKVIERHRKYIIAGLIILTGDYYIMAEYFSEVKGAIT